jgi:hypothetical protein
MAGCEIIWKKCASKLITAFYIKNIDKKLAVRQLIN